MSISPVRLGARHVWLWPSLALAWLVACAERPPAVQADRAAPPTQAGAADALLLAATRVALPPPGLAPADLPDPDSQGAEYVQKYCTRCHALPSPQSHSTTDWPRVIRRMWLRADRVAEAFDVPTPTVAERITLLQYVLGNALKVSGTALPAGPGRDLFRATCSRCHDLPDPKQHAPADWAAVVVRMRQRMEQMLGETPMQSEIRDIIVYLELASKAES